MKVSKLSHVQVIFYNFMNSSTYSEKNWEKLEFILFNRLFYEALENGN